MKGVIQMNKKLLSILGGSALAAMMLIGCNVNDQEPPPEDDAPTEEPAPENGGMDEGNNGNQEGDMDMGEDQNTPEEEPLEDNKDLQDEDNKDQ